MFSSSIKRVSITKDEVKKKRKKRKRSLATVTVGFKDKLY